MAMKYINIEEPDVPVPVRRLIPGTRLPCSVYIKEGDNYTIFFNKDSLHTKVSQKILAEKGISEVYIHPKDSMNLDFYLSANGMPDQTRNKGDLVAFREYAYRKEEHYQIDASFLKCGTSINFGLSALEKFDFIPIVEASETHPVVVDDSMVSVDGDVVIKKSDMPRYLEYISALKHSPALQESDKARVRAIALRETSKAVLQNFLADPKSGDAVKEMQPLINELIDCITGDRDSIYTLLSLKGYDYYTYTHSVNVAALSVGLGAAVDLGRDELEKLGMGAMFHDIGKGRISQEILCKQGRLSAIEYNLIRNHVVEGEKILGSHKSFPAESLAAVVQHHEKLTGKGYPNGLHGNDIGLLAGLPPSRIATMP